MAKRAKEEPKNDNVFYTYFHESLAWVKANRRTAIAAAAAIVFVLLCSWAYAAYESSRDERAQYALSQAMKSFEEYTFTKNGEALNRAEAEFTKVGKIGSGTVRDVANLYLARISLAKGNREDAKNRYTQLARKSSSDVIRKLARNALQDLQKTQ